MTDTLSSYIHTLATAKAPQAVEHMAEHLRSKHPGANAVICYGSALRDSTPQDTLIDYYVLANSIDALPGGWLSRQLCSIIPPNVYYAETTRNGQTLRSKYAMLPLQTLQEKVGIATSNPYFWARFAQPMRLIWAKDQDTEKAVISIFCQAMTTANANAMAMSQIANGLDQWIALFEKTYTTELRPESKDRARLIVETQSQHFETVSRLAPDAQASTTGWVWRKWHGKGLSVLRLLKAAFTFQGGADYAAWKIERHSGVKVDITDWHRRHPVLASIVLLPKLLRKGGLK